MNTLIAVAAILSMIVGVAFLFAAALGVMRFADPLQRMHASTKAGTVGAIFVVLGTVMVHEQSGSMLIGIVAIGFLLITVPVAAHLLGRAIYVSGAYLQGLSGNDALHGHIVRRRAPLEERTEFQPPDRLDPEELTSPEGQSPVEPRS